MELLQATKEELVIVTGGSGFLGRNIRDIVTFLQSTQDSDIL